VTLTCHLCNRSWSLCRACRNSNVIYSPSQLSRHERRYHSEKPVTNTRKISIRKENEIDKDDEIPSSISSHKSVGINDSIPDAGYDSTTFDCFNDDDKCIPNNGIHGNSQVVHHQSTVVTALYEKNSTTNNYGFNDNESFFQLFKDYDISPVIKSLHIINSTSSNYFLAQSRMEGCNFLVTKAHNGKTGSLTSVSSSESVFQMKISLFVKDLTFTQQKLFSDIMFQLSQMNAHTHSQLSTNSDNNLTMKCSLPTNVNNLRRIYLDGRFSINSNLPRPSSIMLRNHSYVSIKEIIADFLGHGKHSFTTFSDMLQSNYWNMDDPTIPVSHFFESGMGKQILFFTSVSVC
jgi:hypothetical protein